MNCLLRRLPRSVDAVETYSQATGSAAIELYQVVADQQRIKITNDLPDEAEIKGDRDLIFELITNLNDNALKYTLDGGNVHLAVHPDNSSHVLSVSDLGCGIPAEKLELVTQRFYRGDS